MHFKHLLGQHDQRKHGRKGPGGGSASLPSWKNLPRVNPNDPSVARTINQRIPATIHTIRENTYDEYLTAVKDYQLPSKGQFLNDGTYIPSQRAIDIARAMQEGMKPNGVLATLPRNAPKWQVDTPNALPDLPERFTPFTKTESQSIELPKLLRLASNDPMQEMYAEMGLSVKTKPMGKRDEKQWRDVLDRLGRFISPTDTNCNPTTIIDGNELIVMSTPNREAWWSNNGALSPWPSNSVIKTYSSSGAMAHELLHEIEFRNPVIQRRVKDFFNRRTDGYRLVDANNLTPDESFNGDTITDLFSHSYTGRSYDPNLLGAEVHEILSTFADALDFMNNDVDRQINLSNNTRLTGQALRYRDIIKDTEHISFVIDLLSDPDSFGVP